MTPLYKAVKGNHWQIVDLLLSNGAQADDIIKVSTCRNYVM